jgi:hypothetical protein
MRPGMLCALIAAAPVIAVIGTLTVILLTGLLIASAGPSGLPATGTPTIGVAP